MNLFIVIAGLLFGSKAEMGTPVPSAAVPGMPQRQGLIVKTAHHSHKNMEKVHKTQGTEKIDCAGATNGPGPRGRPSMFFQPQNYALTLTNNRSDLGKADARTLEAPIADGAAPSVNQFSDVVHALKASDVFAIWGRCLRRSMRDFDPSFGIVGSSQAKRKKL